MRIHLRAEALEARDCPATVNFFNGILTILGTGGNDNIVITQTGNTIRFGGQSFNATNVTKIVVSAQGGDDTVDDRTREAALPSRVCARSRSSGACSR